MSSPGGVIGSETGAQVIDVRDVIAERLERLAGPVRALERMAQTRSDLPARDEALAFAAAVETMVDRYHAFCVADLKAAEGEIALAIAQANFGPVGMH